MLGIRTLPDAPISITAHIRVPHISKDALLITGRGDTADEAVANLHAAIAAVRAPAPPLAPAPSREQALAVLMADALSNAINRADVEGIACAAAYTMRGRIAWHHSVPDACAVRGLYPDDNVYHIVTERTCTCVAWADRQDKGFLCAHMIGVQWWRQLNAVEGTT